MNITKSTQKTFSNFDNSSGRIDIGITFEGGKNGIISFASIKFKPKKIGTTYIDFSSVDIRDKNGNSINMEYPDRITVSIR